MKDVPSSINLRRMDDAREWESSALAKRPSRPAFFELFADGIVNHTSEIHRVLELGSGPGFLAEVLLDRLPDVSYVALDFSTAMHELARTRLSSHLKRLKFVERSFKDNNWEQGLGLFDCVVTNQAVHELRHKERSPDFHKAVRNILKPSGLYLMCDHFYGENGMKNNSLYMTRNEQRDSLKLGGFANPHLMKTEDSLALYNATK